jgi:hypothetical protein
MYLVIQVGCTAALYKGPCGAVMSMQSALKNVRCMSSLTSLLAAALTIFSSFLLDVCWEVGRGARHCSGGGEQTQNYLMKYANDDTVNLSNRVHVIDALVQLADDINICFNVCPRRHGLDSCV